MSEPSPPPPSEPDKQDTESPAETENVPETQNAVAEPASDEHAGMEEERPEQEMIEEQKKQLDKVEVEEQVEETGAAEVAEVGEPRAANVDLQEEFEKEQPAVRDVEDGVPLSEKERQNEEVNEKDNCSASSISSASSTLEREEREEKLSNDIDAGASNANCIHLL